MTAVIARDPVIAVIGKTGSRFLRYAPE